jgi:serpin B
MQPPSRLRGESAVAQGLLSRVLIMRTFNSRVLPFVIASCACLANAACGGSKGSSPPDQNYSTVQSSLSRDMAPHVAPSDMQQLVKDNTTFAFALYHAVASGDETDNLFYSPYSASIALAMTYAGAAGATATQMSAALDLQLPAATLHPAFDSLDLQLTSRAQGQAGDNGQPFKLNVIDSLWGDKTLSFQQPFLDTLALNYGAGVRTVDFSNASDQARDTINAWVSDQTDKLIPTLLPDGSITSGTRFVIVNAIDFNAGWATPFESFRTQPGTFTHLDGSTASPPMMHLLGQQEGYASGPNWQAVELPYAGNQTSMVIVLPQPGQFSAVETALDAAFTSSVFSSLEQSTVDVEMPKFTIQGATISLKQELKKLGMVDAFDPVQANFSALTSEPVVIDDVLHQAYVSVDEKGTLATAATAVIGGDAGIATNPPTPVPVNVNRPFFFVIRDIPTNTVLFVGRVLDPQ